jgi:hypothetical protein
MKITVIADAKGKIIGTARLPQRTSEHDPVFKPVTTKGQVIHEIELPKDLEEKVSAEELHKGLEKHLPKGH